MIMAKIEGSSDKLLLACETIIVGLCETDAKDEKMKRPSAKLLWVCVKLMRKTEKFSINTAARGRG